MSFTFQKIHPPKGFSVDPEAQKESVSYWNSWTWQIKNKITDFEALEVQLPLTEDEQLFFSSLNRAHFRFQVTPYNLEVLKQNDKSGALRKMVLGTKQEFATQKHSYFDPLGERQHSPVPRVIHRYSDRALFLVTDYCGVYCRYCTRKHFTGQDQVFPKASEYQKALDYFQVHKGIKEVILSGGDPLTLSDERILKVISDIRKIPHIEVIRIGTKTPVIMPMRITENLVLKLKKFHPIYIMTHFNHPDELTQSAAQALLKFVNHGFPVFNQMVLLNGVNNHPALVQGLNRRLLFLRVKPHYMFQCDPSEGTDHLRTSIQDSLEIQRELWGHMSSLSMPHLSVDIPGGGGKAYLVPDFVQSIEEERVNFQGWDGINQSYENPRFQDIKKPIVDKKYIKEWETIRHFRPEL